MEKNLIIRRKSMDDYMELEQEDYENDIANEFDSFNSAVVWGMVGQQRQLLTN